MRHDIQQALVKISQGIALRTSLLYKQDIDEKVNNKLCFSFVCFFPRVSYYPRMLLNNFANELDEISELLITGEEVRQIHNLYESAKAINDLLNGYPDTQKIFRIAMAQLVELNAYIVMMRENAGQNQQSIYS